MQIKVRLLKDFIINNKIIMRRMAFVSLGITIVALLLNIFKKAIFSIEPGYAPGEIKFMITVMVPLLAIAMLFSLIVFIKWFSKKKSEEYPKLIELVLAIPGLVLGGFYIIITLFLMS